MRDNYDTFVFFTADSFRVAKSLFHPGEKRPVFFTGKILIFSARPVLYSFQVAVIPFPEKFCLIDFTFYSEFLFEYFCGIIRALQVTADNKAYFFYP